MSRFHENLKALREVRGVTQETLGQKIGVAKSTVSMYESGSREPSFEILEAIADYFNVSLAALMGDVDIAPGLTAEEAGLLADYRALGEEGKRYLRQTVRLARLASAGDWLKK